MKVSVYTKSGERAATTYYRLYQYLREIPIEFCKRKMLSDRIYKKVMPISDKNFIVKICVFVYIYIRVSVQLLKDLFNPPNVLIISRRFINRFFPVHFKWILNSLKKRGCKIIWDFDDQIITSKEITQKGFDYMSKIASNIIVASENNYYMVREEYRNKVTILPTTDGDMYKRLNEDIRSKRLDLLRTEIRLIWVGTSVSLIFLKKIILGLNRYAGTLPLGRKLILTIVCNKPLDIESTEKIEIRNIKWERSVAIEELLSSHIGLMPLEDTITNRGKGGFKLIQYLSVGLPVIGSPVGINSSIITKDVGEQVCLEDIEGWEKAINVISSSPDVWLNYSQRAYNRWSKYYDFDNHLEIWRKLLTQ